MTHRLNLLAIAAIATTTFLSTLVHGFYIELKDTNGKEERFDTPEVCIDFSAPINVVSVKTDAYLCFLYETNDCSSKPGKVQEEVFDGKFEGDEDGFTVNSILCEEKMAERPE
ncbi:hypothetical protein DFQ26_007188 [Actinomortierella ambigua]|nr:hypothetical protein DFQ26_007188 [Actinomortierella ambigua]